MQEVESIKKDNPILIRHKGIIKKLWCDPLALAFFFNLLALLLRLFFFNIKYESSDDYMTDALLSGAFGNGYDPNLLFGNPILGHFLVLLYRLVPRISFYFLLLMVLGFVSVTAILYILFKKNMNITARVIAVLFLLFYADDLYILVQFTKVSAAAGIAGGLLVLYALCEEKQHQIRLFVLGTILTVLGAMVRFTTIYVFASFLVMGFLFYAYAQLDKRRNTSEQTGNIKKELFVLGRRFLVCVLLIGVLFALHYLGQWISDRDPEYRAFNEYHAIRCNISDVNRPEYEDVADEYEKLGLSELDYYMIGTWNFIDKEVYSDELLTEVGKIHKQASDDMTHSLSYVIDLLMIRNTLTYWSAIGLYVLAVIALLLSKHRLYPLLILMASIGFQLAFIYTGRTMYRVEWSVYFCAAACILCSFDFDERVSSIRIINRISSKGQLVIDAFMVILVSGFLLASAPRLFIRRDYKSMSQKEYTECFNNTLLISGEYDPEKCLFPTNDIKPFPNIIERMENDPDHFYYVDFFTGIQSLYFNYAPWIRPEKGLFCKDYAYFGSVAMHQPGERYALIANGCDPDSPYKSLVNEDVFLVDTRYAYVKLAYVQKYYYPEAQMEQVDEVDGFKIWKIYVPERSVNND